MLAHDDEGRLFLSSTVVADAYPALTPEVAQAHWFEREIAEQWGVRPLGHPWLNFPLCNKSFNLSYCGHDL